MEKMNLRPRQISSLSTVNPQVLQREGDVLLGPFPGKRFNAEEWEGWMQWDGATESLSPQTPSDRSSPGFPTGSVSHGSTSPSEAESVPHPPLTPVYRIPSIDREPKGHLSSSDSRKASSKKRKTSSATEGQEVRTRQPKGQKISHNVIEKRYRTNLNDKIAKLRDSVPTLKSAFEASQRQHDKDGGESGSEESGSEDKAATSGIKFNKATVLTKATEYIEQLERANAKLLSENSTLRKRVKDSSSDARGPKPLYFRAEEANATGSDLPNQVKIEFENKHGVSSPLLPEFVPGKIPVAVEFQKLRAEAADQPSYAPAGAESSSSTVPHEHDAQQYLHTAHESSTELIDFDSVQGAIPIPDDLKRNRVPISQQQHYAPDLGVSRFDDLNSDTFAVEDDESSNWWPRNRASKLLLGSLAGLMIMEGFSANIDHPDESKHLRSRPTHKKRRQFLPDDFYTESRGFRAQIRHRIIDFAHSPQGKKALPVLLLSAIILGVVFLGFVYLSRNDPKARRRANSVSSNPERDNAVQEECEDQRSCAKMPKEKTAVTGGTRGSVMRLPTATITTTKHQQSFISEAQSRMAACWRILRQGEHVQSTAEQKFAFGDGIL